MNAADSNFLYGTLSQGILVEAPLERVWAAFADLDLRDRWFTMPGERSTRSHELDFRIGGSEITRGTFMNFDRPEVLEHRSRFIDIEAGRRITTVYDFVLNDVLRFASLVTVELAEAVGGTRVDYTEQYQFFNVDGDGSAERGEREGGTKFLLRRLKIAVEQIPQA